jgi:hypothetical protein
VSFDKEVLRDAMLSGSDSSSRSVSIPSSARSAIVEVLCAVAKT